MWIAPAHGLNRRDGQPKGRKTDFVRRVFFGRGFFGWERGVGRVRGDGSDARNDPPGLPPVYRKTDIRTDPWIDVVRRWMANCVCIARFGWLRTV